MAEKSPSSIKGDKVTSGCSWCCYCYFVCAADVLQSVYFSEEKCAGELPLPVVGRVGHPGAVEGGGAVQAVLVAQEARPRERFRPLVLVQERVVGAVLEAHGLIERDQDIQQVALGRRWNLSEGLAFLSLSEAIVA